MRALIVDGYNAIHAWPELRRLLATDMEQARLRLIHLLAAYGAGTGVEVTVVFDAHGGSGTPQQQRIDGVTVVFGTDRLTADNLIERLATAATREGISRDVVVATSDRLQRELVFAMGVAVMSSAGLLEEILRVEQDSAQSMQGPSSPRFDRLEDRLDPEARAALERMRRGQSEDR